MNTRKLVAITLLLMLVFASVPVSAEEVSVIVPVGSELSEDDLAEIEGEWGWLAVGALAGAIEEAVSYSVSHADDFSWKELGKRAARGAAFGLVGSSFGVVGTIAKAGKYVSRAVRASDVAWRAWSASNVGALHGAYEAAERHSR